MSNNLCYWCKRLHNENDDLKMDCKEVCLEEKKYDLLDFVVDNLPENLEKEIQFKRKSINNIKKLELKNNYLASKKKLL